MSNPLSRPEFKRASLYDPQWVMDGAMGPNPLWMLEWLCSALEIKPGMRVLDLGCGKAITSIFLAREFKARVWAADLWVDPDRNWPRIQTAGVADLVCPMRVEAHALPFAAGFFDAVVSVDAYQYFGTDQLYLGYLTNFVAPGGQIGIAVPGLTREFDGPVPEHLAQPQGNGKAFWENECFSFHSPEWWRQLWSRSGVVEVKTADLMPDGWRRWADFEKAREAAGKNEFPSDAEALEQDGGRNIGLVRVTAMRSSLAATNLYDPALMAKMGL